MAGILLSLFRLVHTSPEWWIGAKVCLAQCPPSGIKIFLLSGTLQLWNSSMHSEHWKRCEWKWSRYLRHPLVLHWYSQKEKPVVGLPAEGALKQWPYLKYWPLSDYKSVWSCQNLEGEMCCEGRTIISACILSFCARLALYKSQPHKACRFHS